MSIQFDTTGPGATPRDAATVVVVRDGATGLEVFFVQRRATVQFMGGAYVFPGGKLDAEDADPRWIADLDAAACARRLGETDPRAAHALHVAAVRECFEESGILYAKGAPDVTKLMRNSFASLRSDGNVALTFSALQPFSRWVTPRGETRRFDTRFFLARAPENAQGSHDEGETVASVWLTPASALALAGEGRIVLVPPTYVTVQLLARCSNVREALAMAPPVIPTVGPRIMVSSDGAVDILLPGDPEHGEPMPKFVAGDSIDPATIATRFSYRNGTWTTR